jgi:DNA polymerase-1
MAMQLYPIINSEIEKEGLTRLLNDVELPLVRVLAEMEIAGVRIDVTALNEASVALTTRLQEIEAEVFELAGEEFNIGSPAKVGEILFDKLRLDPKAKKTKTGQYSTSEEVLEKIAHLHPIVGKVLEHRQLRKLLSTYLNALPNTINPSTGKIHTTYNQTVTATGRLSSTEPNLQNIPVRDDVGREIRRAFIADEGHLFLSADYSQIELRLVADLAADEVMLDAFANDKDIHAITAAKIYKVPLEEVTATQRRNAKTANFGILYGISAFGLASRLSIPRAEAKQLIDGYFATFPTVQTYMNEAIEKAREKGYVTTIMGRKRMLPDINSRNAVVRGYAERNAINAPIQGSAADIIKVAMVSIFNEMTERNLKSKMIMQVHDELNFDVAADELDVMRELVSRNMEAAYSGRVRLTASCGVGPNWLTAH